MKMVQITRYLDCTRPENVKFLKKLIAFQERDNRPYEVRQQNGMDGKPRKALWAKVNNGVKRPGAGRRNKPTPYCKICGKEILGPNRFILKTCGADECKKLIRKKRKKRRKHD